MESLKEAAIDAAILVLAWLAVTAGSMFHQSPSSGLSCDHATSAAPSP